jgi:geranylgeranyl transferase type-1 subunit beta
VAAGLNYCGIATLSFLGLLQKPPTPAHEVARQAGVDTAGCTKWMLDRQTTWIEDEDEDEEEGEVDDAELKNDSLDMSAMREQLDTQKMIAGFCGRCGKMADTCYCFWNVGALAVSSFDSYHR